MSPVFQSRNVPCGSRRDISALGEGCRKAFAPGMIGSWLGRQALGLEGEVQLFGRDNLSLPGLLFVNAVRQGFAIIQDRDFFLGVDTNEHLGFAQSIRGAVGLDLVDGLVKLQGEVLGKGASLLPGENSGEILFGGQGTMGIDGTSGFYRKALVEVLEELGQIGIALGHIGDVPQA